MQRKILVSLDLVCADKYSEVLMIYFAEIILAFIKYTAMYQEQMFILFFNQLRGSLLGHLCVWQCACSHSPFDHLFVYIWLGMTKIEKSATNSYSEAWLQCVNEFSPPLRDPCYCRRCWEVPRLTPLMERSGLCHPLRFSLLVSVQDQGK